MENVEHLLAVQNQLGEGPLWKADEGALYWVNIEGKSYQRYVPASGELQTFDVGVLLGVLRFRRAGGMVMATSAGIQFWDAHSARLTPVADPEAGKVGARFNDGAVDPQGRFWAGTMAPDRQTGNLYRLDPDLSIHCMDSGIGVSNGIAWSLDGKTMYFTDSPRKVIYAYDFDAASGEIANRRPFISTPDELGAPDGLIIDSQGFLWSARWGGWNVGRYDPDGKLERTIPMPVEFPTCCAFGGEDLTDLYITSAWTNLGEKHHDLQPLSGDLFVLHTDIRGRSEPKFIG